jgi:hypothetical protein
VLGYNLLFILSLSRPRVNPKFLIDNVFVFVSKRDFDAFPVAGTFENSIVELYLIVGVFWILGCFGHYHKPYKRQVDNRLTP